MHPVSLYFSKNFAMPTPLALHSSSTSSFAMVGAFVSSQNSVALLSISEKIIHHENGSKTEALHNPFLTCCIPKMQNA